jgi:hypothetical protein
MKQLTRDIPIDPVDEAQNQENEVVVLANISYDAIENLEKLTTKSIRRSTLCLGITLGVGAVMVAMMGANLAKSTQSFIARSNGQTETLEFYSGNERSNVLIQGFAGRFVQNLYSWRSVLPEGGSPIDKGVEVEGGKRLPSAVWKATLGMETRFASVFRKGLAELISNNVKDTDLQVTYIPKFVQTPEKIGGGKWKARAIGSQIIVSGNGKDIKTKPVAVELTLKAVPPPTINASDRQSQGIRFLAAAARAEGLEVTHITNLTNLEK